MNTNTPSSNDFAKYATTAKHKYSKQVYDKTPGLVSQQIKYVNVSSEMESRFLKEAISDLNKAGVIFPSYSTSASGLPLLTHINEKNMDYQNSIIKPYLVQIHLIM